MFKQRNFNVIITGRDSEYTMSMANKLNNDYPSRSAVKGYKLDFTNLHESSDLLNSLESRDLKPSYLINNAGVLFLNNISLDTKKLQNDKFELNYPTIEKAIINLLL